MGITPLKDRVLVKPLDAETVSAGGIVLPPSAQEKSTKGLVISVGPGRRLESGERVPLDVKGGDTVLFGKYAGSTTVELEGVEHYLLREDELLGVFSDD